MDIQRYHLRAPVLHHHLKGTSQVSENASEQKINIGDRLRAVRTARRLSQRELARKSGVTNGLISQIEQNLSSPSVASLKRILDAIPLTLSEFFAADEKVPEQVFFPAADPVEIRARKLFQTMQLASGISLRQIVRSDARRMQMLEETYAPGADSGIEAFAVHGEETGVVISGRIELAVADQSASLGPGDGYRFDGMIPHRFRNTGREPCILISATCRSD